MVEGGRSKLKMFPLLGEIEAKKEYYAKGDKHRRKVWEGNPFVLKGEVKHFF